jgi:hypothetical protein
MTSWYVRTEPAYIYLQSLFSGSCTFASLTTSQDSYERVSVLILHGGVQIVLRGGGGLLRQSSCIFGLNRRPYLSITLVTRPLKVTLANHCPMIPWPAIFVFGWEPALKYTQHASQIPLALLAVAFCHTTTKGWHDPMWHAAGENTTLSARPDVRSDQGCVAVRLHQPQSLQI